MSDEAFNHQVDHRHVCKLEGEYVTCSCPTSSISPSIRAAVAFSYKAVAEDNKKNYGEAIKYYKECEKNYVYAVDHVLKNDAIKQACREKAKKIQNRIQDLTFYMDEISKMDTQK